MVKLYIYPMFLLFLFSSCKDLDFGQKALTYVEYDLENDSRELVNSDLKVRFDHAFQTGLREMHFHSNKINEIFNNLSSAWIKIKDQTKERNPEKAAAIHVHYIRKTLPILIGAKLKMEILEKRIHSLKNICSKSFLQSKGISYLGYISPMSSFTDMQKIAEDFVTQTNIQLLLASDRGDVGSMVDRDISTAIGITVATVADIMSGGGVSALGYGLITTLVASGIDGISSAIVRNKIKHQKHLLREAINKSANHVMRPGEVDALAMNYCQEKWNIWEIEIDDWNKKVNEMKNIWNKNYIFLMKEVDKAHAILKPIQMERIFNSGLDIQKMEAIRIMEINREIKLGAQDKWIKLALLFQEIKESPTGCDKDLQQVEILKDGVQIYKKEAEVFTESKDEDLKGYFIRQKAKADSILSKMNGIYQEVISKKCIQGTN